MLKEIIVSSLGFCYDCVSFLKSASEKRVFIHCEGMKQKNRAREGHLLDQTKETEGSMGHLHSDIQGRPD